MYDNYNPWMYRPLGIYKCNKCMYEWETKVRTPGTCPRCNRRLDTVPKGERIIETGYDNHDRYIIYNDITNTYQAYGSYIETPKGIEEFQKQIKEETRLKEQQRIKAEEEQKIYINNLNRQKIIESEKKTKSTSIGICLFLLSIIMLIGLLLIPSLNIIGTILYSLVILSIFIAGCSKI